MGLDHTRLYSSDRFTAFLHCRALGSSYRMQGHVAVFQGYSAIVCYVFALKST